MDASRGRRWSRAHRTWRCGAFELLAPAELEDAVAIASTGSFCRGSATSRRSSSGATPCASNCGGGRDWCGASPRAALYAQRCARKAWHCVWRAKL